MTDVYGYWRAALKGQKVLPTLPTLYATGAAVDNPQPGFYRMSLKKDGPLIPVRIWLSNGDGEAVHKWQPGLDLQCVVDGRVVPAKELAERWTFCRAVSKADMAHYDEHKRWPGEIEHGGPGHNSGELSLEDEARDVLERAVEWMDKLGKVETQDQADQVANFKGRLGELRKDAESEHKSEKAPHLAAGRAVDAKWKPLIGDLQDVVKRLGAFVTPFLRRKEAEARAAAEAERKRAEEENRKRLEEAEAARKKQMEEDPIAALTSEPEEPELLPVPDAKPKAQAGGQHGKRTSLRTYKVPRITDYDKVLAHFKDHDDVKAVIETLCKRAAKAGLPVPGMEIVEEQRAA